jgi:hypothetical protein
VEVGQRSRPAPFSQYTTPEFWADPHIAASTAARPHPLLDRTPLVEPVETPGSRLLVEPVETPGTLSDR